MDPFEHLSKTWVPIPDYSVSQAGPSARCRTSERNRRADATSASSTPIARLCRFISIRRLANCARQVRPRLETSRDTGSESRMVGRVLARTALPRRSARCRVLESGQPLPGFGGVQQRQWLPRGVGNGRGRRARAAAECRRLSGSHEPGGSRNPLGQSQIHPPFFSATGVARHWDVRHREIAQCRQANGGSAAALGSDHCRTDCDRHGVLATL